MLKVIICDDDKFMLDLSSNLVEKCMDLYKIKAEICCVTSDFNEVIHFIKKNENIYLFFLDLDFGKGNLNGIDVAKQIKEFQPLSKIVFVTSHADMGMTILKSGVEAFGFIEKNIDINKMLVGYRKYMSLASGLTMETNTSDMQEEKKVDLPVGIDEYVSIPLSQILYVESDKTTSHFVSYHTVDGSSISVRDTIERVLETLGCGFMKSHRSVIINKKYVVAVANGLVKFANGQEVNYSVRLKNEIIKQCLRQE